MIEQLAESSGRAVSRETMARLSHYQGLVEIEGDQQNLIARSTMDAFWLRHVVDSAQLCRFARPGARWLDIGSGAGLPGIVLAVLTADPVTLVEPRRLRAEFLQRCIDELDLRNAKLVASKVERVAGQFDAITARAVACVDALFGIAHRLSHPGTRWILPKGRSGAIELAEAQRNWQGQFRTVPSITDGDAVIVVAEQVGPKHGPRG